MRRQCARPGCSAVATTTFTFDSHEQIVYLDAPSDGGARAGELCARHARGLAPPRGWHVVDRREPEGVPRSTETAPPPARLVQAAAASVPAAAPSWHPRFERGDTLDGVLEADTPLLSRAFRNVRAG